MHNESIKPSDSEKYDLVCFNYCSYGYCSCDLMPRIDEYISYKYKKSENKEDVYLISEEHQTHTDIQPNYMAWTIPSIFVDE